MTPRARVSLLAGVVLVSTATQFYLAHRFFGFVGGDDVEILSEAFRVATGFRYSSWDIRNLFVPHFVVAPLISLARRLGVSETRTLIAIAAWPFILLTSATTLLVDRLAWRWTGDPSAALVSATVFAFHWIPLGFGSTVYPRTIATFCIVAAALLLSSPGRLRAVAAGLLAGLAVADRFSEAVFLAPLLALAGRRALLVVAGAALMIGLTIGVYDAFTWGAPFSSLVKFARLTLLEPDFSSRLKYQSPFWYLTSMPRWLAFTALPLLFMSRRLKEPWFFIAVPLLALSFVRHKEIRYLHGLIPFVAIAVGYGFSALARKRGPLLAGTLLAATLLWQVNGLKLFAKKSQPAVMAAEDLADDRSVRSVLVCQNWAYGGQLFLGNEVHVVDLGVPPRLERLRALGPDADAVAMYESDMTVEWRRALRRLGFRATNVYRDGPAKPVVLYRRALSE